MADEDLVQSFQQLDCQSDNDTTEKDPGWDQFATFIDSLIRFLSSSSSNSKIVDDLLGSGNIYSVADRLVQDVGFKKSIADYFDKVFPLEMIRCHFRKDTEIAAKLKNDAEQFRSQEKLDESLAVYSRAVCFAEPETVLFQELLSARNDLLKKMNEKNTETIPELSDSLVVSEKIDLCQIDGKNRGFRVKPPVPVDPGELVVQETPLAVHLFQPEDDDVRYCLNCLTDVQFRTFVPCIGCNRYVFCNQQCQHRAWQRFHRQECHRFMFALEPEIGVGYLVARMICSETDSVTDVTQAITYAGEGQDDDFWNRLAQQKSNLPYYRALSLMDHHREHDSDSKKSYLLAAFVLCHCFQKMEIFKNHPFPDESSLIKLLIHHLMQLSTNLITVYQHQDDDEDSSERSIGMGLYPTVSMFNHSCRPDVVTRFIGSTIRLQANHRIEVGQEICTTYGPTHLNMDYRKRQRFLRDQYHFDCRCMACERRWQNWSRAWLCPQCNGPAFKDTTGTGMICLNEHRTENLEPIRERIRQAGEHRSAGIRFFRQYTERNDDEDLVAALVAFHKADMIVTETLYRLHWMWLAVKRSVADCYNQMGHNDRSAIYTRQIIDSYERFGDCPELWPPLVQERVRLIKILRLMMDEQEDSEQLQKEIQRQIELCLPHLEYLSPEDASYIQNGIC